MIFHSYLSCFPNGAVEARKVLSPSSAQMARLSLGEINGKVVIAAMSRTKGLRCNIGAYITTNTILGVPYYKYSVMGPRTLFQLLRPQC